MAKHADTGRFYVIHADIEKRKPEDIVGIVVALAEVFQGNLKVSIESNQFQQLLVTAIEEQAYKQGVRLSMGGIHHSTDKLARIQSLEPWINTGRILFAHNQRQLIDQLLRFPKGAHDDGPDALEMAISSAKTQRMAIGCISLNGDDDDYGSFAMDGTDDFGR